MKALCLFLATLITANLAVFNRDTVVKDHNGKAILDKHNKYSLDWSLDWNTKVIRFNISVTTTGWVGIGFSKDGSMRDADLVIAGVGPDGRPYIQDMYSDCHRNIQIDNSNDYNLIGANEFRGKTILTIARPFDTCDSSDYQITDDLVFVLWAFGETDVIGYHYQNRGNKRMYLLDPIMHSSLASKSLPKWRVTRRLSIPPKRTTYWCSIHRAPRFTRPRHIIEFHPILENELAVKHTHHFVVWRCTAPRGVDPRKVFEPLLDYPGEECYLNNANRIPIELCRQMIYVWALGGTPLILPDHVGYVLGKSVDEFYMLETHYDNPEEITGIRYETGFEGLYTTRLRQFEGGTFIVNYDFFGYFMIPPGTQQFQMYSHCGQECTENMFPPSGVDVFAVHFHTHRSGRRMKLRQFRNGNELPWVMKDDNFDYTFQIARPLQDERTFLPGDQLTLDCIYSNTWTNVTTVAGFGSTDEMCLATVYHTKEIPFFQCSGQVPQERLLGIVGVQNITWDNWTEERIVESPHILRGATLALVTDDLTNWTTQKRQTTQDLSVSTPQVVSCPNVFPVGRPHDVIALARSYGMRNLNGPLAAQLPSGKVILSRFPTTNLYRRTQSCLAH